MEEHGKSEMLTWCCPASDTDAYSDSLRTGIPLHLARIRIQHYEPALGLADAGFFSPLEVVR